MLTKRLINLWHHLVGTELVWGNESGSNGHPSHNVWLIRDVALNIQNGTPKLKVPGFEGIFFTIMLWGYYFCEGKSAQFC